MTQGAAATLRHELIGFSGVVQRNVYLVKRYIWWDVAFMLWTIANTLTIVFIARGVNVSEAQQNALATKFLVGGAIWAFLGIIFEIVTETVAGLAWGDVWPLLLIGAAAVPLGLVIFHRGERYAKQHGKLKRSG